MPKFGGADRGRQACVRKQAQKAALLSNVVGDRALACRQRAVQLLLQRPRPPAGDPTTEGGDAPDRDRRNRAAEKCAFCMEPLGEAYAEMDTCDHAFHADCLERWASCAAEQPHNVPTRNGVRVQCPYCRRNSRRPPGGPAPPPRI